MFFCPFLRGISWGKVSNNSFFWRRLGWGWKFAVLAWVWVLRVRGGRCPIRAGVGLHNVLYCSVLGVIALHYRLVAALSQHGWIDSTFVLWPSVIQSTL